VNPAGTRRTSARVASEAIGGRAVVDRYDAAKGLSIEGDCWVKNRGPFSVL
jgi:hypothetical protein